MLKLILTVAVALGKIAITVYPGTTYTNAHGHTVIVSDTVIVDVNR